MLNRRKFLLAGSAVWATVTAFPTFMSAVPEKGVLMHSGSTSPAQWGKSGAAPPVIAFDIYGTVIDPDGMAAHLETRFGGQAEQATRLWREKQIEFTFRRALMRKYVDFDVCTAQALNYVGTRLGVSLSDQDKVNLLDAYLSLPTFPDARYAFQTLKAAGYRVVALSNGTAASVRTLLKHAEVIEYFEAIVSADTIKTFKPDPAVYESLVGSVSSPKEGVWLVSSNPWDVIGAKAYGLKAAWVQRDPARIFDPWEFSPDITIPSLEKLVDAIQQQDAMQSKQK